MVIHWTLLITIETVGIFQCCYTSGESLDSDLIKTNANLREDKSSMRGNS